MAQACFDPSEAPKLWERMSAGEGVAGKFDFMSTHPASQKRIRVSAAEGGPRPSWQAPGTLLISLQNLEKEQPQALEIRAKHCGYTEQQFGSFNNLFSKNGPGSQQGSQDGVPTWG